MRIRDWSSDVSSSDLGRWVRDQHTDIKGVDAAGRRYHALTPETYWWAHATFQFMAEQVVDRYDDRRLSPEEREQLYQEGLVWYRRYGVSDRDVPATREAFQERWDHYCAEVLEMNERSEGRRVGKEGVRKGRSRWAPEH